MVKNDLPAPQPLIADLFRRIEMVETCGRGIPLILKFVPDAGFREIGNMFIVSFPRPSFGELKLDQLVMKINFCKRALVVSGKAEKSKSMALYTP